MISGTCYGYAIISSIILMILNSVANSGHHAIKFTFSEISQNLKSCTIDCQKKKRISVVDLRLCCITENLTWERATTSGTPPSPRDSHTCSSWNKKIIVLGGEDQSDCYLSDVYMLDAGTFRYMFMQL